ncbi:caskin-2-like isoform X2 [Rhopilema esculentum]|uniref:caskin-2-like isoform X2 n=1 Tax=Rhopilema esculentum TaxID=499914 RepID=UPI0031DDF035
MGKDTELLNAVKNGDVSIVRKFLLKFKSNPKGKKSVSKKLHINVPDDDGFTILHHASLGNNVEIVLAILELEGDPNSRDKKGMCPLHMAAWSGKDKIVKTLLENRALVNLPSFGGETPLLLASQHGHGGVVEVLMKHNADPSIRNNNLESPLDLACQFGHTAVVRCLLMRGEMVQMLRERQTDPRYKQPLHLAGKGGHADVVRLLIENGSDVNEQSPQGTCLHLAALYGKVEVVKLLLEVGADVRAINNKNMTPLDMVNQYTKSNASIEIKQLLREAAGEHVVFATAVSNHINVYDETSLSFKAGDTVMVLEQNEDGRWKGSVNDGKAERTGYFPSKSVSIISKKRETQSLGSLSSSSDSSVNSALSGKDGNQPIKSPSRRMTESNKPVGVVPVGTYEVLTLAPTLSPDSKKPPNIPRLNSFKKDSKTASAQRQKIQAREEFSASGSLSNRSSSADTSNDSGIHSRLSGTIVEATYDAVPGHPRLSMEANVYDAVPQPALKSPRIFPTQSPFEQHEPTDQDKQRTTNYPGTNYAEIAFKNGGSPGPDSMAQKTKPNYADVYIADQRSNEFGQNGPRIHSEARTIPGTSTGNRHLECAGEKEKMDLNEELLSRMGRTPEEKASLRSTSMAFGYEDMQGHSMEEPFPSPPPPLPLKNQASAEIPPSPPKKIESRIIHHRQDNYENVQPRQFVPVHVQNPFDFATKDQLQEMPNLQSEPYVDYENYMPPTATMPANSPSNYENFFPSSQEAQKPRSATVAAKSDWSTTRPVPLPPKMNRKSCQEPFSPIAPTDSVKTPFLCQLNMDEKTQDEKELLSWLIDLKLPQYFQNFHSEGYDMISVRGVTPEDLTTIGITKAGHRKKLLSEITKLGPSPRLPTHKPAEVGQWLTLLDLAAYESNFIEGGFDEMDFIKDLDLSDLEMIEIKKKGHQKKLLLAVQKLSDVELTAELDAVVAVSKSDSPVSKTQAPRKPAKRLDERAEPSSLQGITPPSLKPLKPIATANHTLTPPAEEIEESTREFSFPAPPPANELESAFLLNRDNLPPPSGKESSNPAGEPNVPTPPKAPVRAQTQKVNQSVNQEAPRPRLRTSSQPVAPKPKPKPRPAQNVGQVRTASEYHANEAPAVIKPTTPQKPNLKAASEDSESAVTASRSRDFWLQNQQQPQPPSQAAVTPTRTKSISGIKPLPAQRPNTMPDAESPAKTPPEPLTRKPSLKKVPPPTPPRRDSMSSKKPEAAHDSSQNGNESTLAERSRTFSGPLDEKIRETFRGKATKHTPVNVAIPEQAPEEKPDSSKSKIDEELAATDSIMADIDDMIADFTNQLDSMF